MTCCFYRKHGGEDISASSEEEDLQGRGYKADALTDPTPTPDLCHRSPEKAQEPPAPTSTTTSTPCDCRTDLIIASCRVSVLQKCEWRSDAARTKGRSAAPPSRADRLAAETHNETAAR